MVASEYIVSPVVGSMVHFFSSVRSCPKPDAKIAKPINNANDNVFNLTHAVKLCYCKLTKKEFSIGILIVE